MFNAEEYKKLLAQSENISEVEGVPLPVVREDQNYIFISYSHKDYKQVYSDLADLYDAGVRFWYDRGLKPGKDWDAMVLEKIQSQRCSGVIFYLSKNLYLSPAIKREISIVTGHDEITGQVCADAKAYFSVNLTDGAPSDIVFSISAEEKKEKKLDSRWLKLLMDTFSDESTYLPYGNSRHKAELLENICDMFNVVNDADVIVMAEGDYTGEILNGHKHGTGTFAYTTGHLYEGQWENDVRCGEGTLSRNGKVIYRGQWRDDRFNGYGEYTYIDGTTYKGQFVNGRREGQGSYTYASGATYEGQWANGQRHGQGSYVYGDEGENKRRYTGQWMEDRMEGKGTFTFKDGSTYDGDFVNWKFDGFGLRKYATGGSYEGYWQADNQNGQGTYTYADGKSWTGEFKDDKMWTGEGFLYYFTDGKPNGKTFEGTLVEGKYQGYGVFHYANGSVYEGQWDKGLRHGQGKYTYGDDGEHKRTYVGQWTEDRMEGKGIFTYKDGSTYEGDFVDWKFEGHGVRKYADGSVYDGQWHADNQNGYAVYVYASGIRYEGEFKDNQWHGQGTKYYDDGKCWTGEFKDGKSWNGKGFLYYYTDNKRNGRTYDGEMAEGKYHGFGVHTRADGAVYEGQWVKGQRHGQGKYTYADEGEHKRTYVGQWTEDRMEGKGTFTFKDGSIYEGDFVDWKFEGYGLRKYANGCTYEGQWTADNQNGQGTYTYADGKSWTGEFNNDRMWTGDGFIYYYSDGKRNGKTYEGQLVNGLREGVGRYDYGDNSSYEGQWVQGNCQGRGLYESVSAADEFGPLVILRKDGLWKNNHMIEGHVIMLRRTMNGSMKEIQDNEGKIDYKGDMLGPVKIKKGNRVKTRLKITGLPIFYPNWKFLYSFLENAIWQFDGKDCQTPDGYGTATFYNGIVMEGWFKNGKPEETKPCTMTYPDGGVYTGTVKGTKRMGQGRYVTADGYWMEGYFDDIFMSGEAHMQAVDGSIYTGQLSYAEYHGYGKLVKPDGTVYAGKWANGKLVEPEEQGEEA